jgi:predicted transcriptional regulator
VTKKDFDRVEQSRRPEQGRAAATILNILIEEEEGLGTATLRERLEARGVKWSTAQRVLKNLVESGTIRVEKRGGKANRYTPAESLKQRA